MTKSSSSPDDQCFATHFYKPQSSEEKNRRKALYMAQVYRKKRTKYVNCALSLDEYDSLKECAEKSGRKPTKFLREAAFAYMGQHYLVPKNIDAKMANLVALLRNVAGNINQIARRTNRWQKLTVIDLLQARSLLSKQEEAIKEFLSNPTLKK
jgi:hypothetical protein